MPLQGSLGQIGLADVLQTALAGQAGGDLILSRGPERAVLHVAEDGLHLLEPEVLEPEEVIAAFQERGVLSREILAQASGKSGLKGLGLIDQLTASGVLPEAELLEVVAGAAEDTILDLLTWNEGTFRFEENTSLPSRSSLVGRVAVDRGSVLLRAAQRIDERTAIAQAVGLQTRLFLANAAPPPPEDPADPLVRVHAALDGRSTVEEIALRLGLSRFETLKAAAALVEVQAARPARAEELAVAVPSRLGTKQYRVARLLALQWLETDTLDPAPLRALATLGEKRDRPGEVVAALSLLGLRLLKRGEAPEAVRVFQDALERRPGDLSALEGLRAASAQLDDAGLWTSATLRMAQAATDDGDPRQAAALAAEVLERHPNDLGALLVRARALTVLKDREGVTQTAEAVLAAVGKRATRRVELEAAAFCRDAVALLAPERSDLLRSLRAVSEKRAGNRRRAVLVGALVAVAAGAGVMVWPVRASGLLDDARAAAEAGDKGKALALVAQLLERFPDSDEATEAQRIQAQVQPSPVKPRPGNAAPRPSAATLPPLATALAALPAPEARAVVAQHVEALSQAATPTSPPPEVQRAVAAAVGRLQLELRGRIDALALTAEAPRRSKGKDDVLRAVVASAEQALDPARIEAWQATVPALGALAAAAKATALQRELTGLPELLDAYERSRTAHAADLGACRAALAAADLAVLHQACREQGPRLLVAGRLDDLDRCYDALEQRLTALAGDPAMAPVVEQASREGLGDFLRERRTLLAGIRAGLAAAKAAEAAGDLEAAGKAYAALAQRHYTVRFDDLIQVPLAVVVRPSGARVRLNGADVDATSPLHYRWGAPVTLTVEAPGFEPLVRVLEAREGVPVTRVEAQLRPQVVWSAPVTGALEARPLALGDDVLVCDRSGRVSRHAGADGRVLWSRALDDVEGVRGRPAADGGHVLVVFVSGRAVVLDAQEGRVLSDELVARPFGDAAALGDAAAVATTTPGVVGWVRGRRTFAVALPASPSTSLLAGHGAFWVGTNAGQLVRLHPTTGAVTTFALPGPASAVTALAPSAAGWLACLSDGRLIAVGTDGAPRWSASNLGDLGPAPTEVGSRVAVSDRRGRITLLDAATGAVRGGAALGAEPVGGLLATATCLVATTTTGRLWIYDVAGASVRVEAPFSDKGLLAPTLLACGDLSLLGRDGRLQRVPLAPAPAPMPAPSSPAPSPAAPTR